MKMMKHLYLECDFYINVGRLGLHWLKNYTVRPEDIGSHAFQFGGAYAFKKEICRLFSCNLVGLHLSHLERAKC